MAKLSKAIFARPPISQLTSFFIKLSRKSAASAIPIPNTRLHGHRHAKQFPASAPRMPIISAEQFRSPAQSPTATLLELTKKIPGTPSPAYSRISIPARCPPRSSQTTPAPCSLVDNHFLRKHGSARSYGQPKEKERSDRSACPAPSQA